MGALAVVLALAMFALPPLLVNTYVAMREVDQDVKDAAAGMGMTGGQVLRRVELPLSFPLAFAGFRTATVQVVATATFGALVGAGTLGQYIYEGFSIQDYDELYGGVVLVAVLCIVIDRCWRACSVSSSRRTGRSRGGSADGSASLEAPRTRPWPRSRSLSGPVCSVLGRGRCDS